MGLARGWLGAPAFLCLALLLAVPAAALDVGVQWGLGEAPTAVTLEATDVAQEAATLRGSLSDLGAESSVQVNFEWGTSPGLGQETASETRSSPGTFEATLEELTPGTTYYYRAKAVGNQTAMGETLTFQTAPGAFAGDLFSQLWLWLVLAAIAAVMGYLLTRRQLAARRKPGEPGAVAEKASKAKKGPGGLFARAGGLLAVTKRASKAPKGDVGVGVGMEAPSEVLCPHCGIQLAGTAVYCYGCGRGLAEGADMDQRVERAKGALVENELDRDALFTLGAHLAAAGKGQEALEILNRLSMLDPDYPGLWWVKVRVFESLGNPEAAEAAMMRAMQTEEGSGVEALLTAAGQVEAKGDEGPPGPETCPRCETTLEPETGNCPICGHSVVDQGEALEAKVYRALGILELDENDTDALFTLGAYLLLDGQIEKALETLNRLTLLDPSYPGLWWVKAQVFEKLGNKRAAESARARAQQGVEVLEEDE